MKKSLSIALPVLALAGHVFLLSCCTLAVGSGHVITLTRPASGFTGVSLRGTGAVSIVLGEKEEVRIEAEDNLVPYLETIVENGTLEIGSRPGVLIRPTKPINYYVTMKTLNALSLPGSGRIEAPDFSTDRFRATVSGSGEIAMKTIKADDVELSISGSGNLSVVSLTSSSSTLHISGNGKINLAEWNADKATAQISGSGAVFADAGEVKEQQITISGSGAYRDAGVKCDTADISVPGSGEADVRVGTLLKVRVSGSGNVRYSGKPQVETSITGSGRVRAAGE